MKGQHLAARLHFLAVQLQGEAQRQPAGSEERRRLELHARTLRWAFSSAYTKDPVQLTATQLLAVGAVNHLVAVITTRTEHELSKGAPS